MYASHISEILWTSEKQLQKYVSFKYVGITLYECKIATSTAFTEQLWLLIHKLDTSINMIPNDNLNA